MGLSLGSVSGPAVTQQMRDKYTMPPGLRTMRQIPFRELNVTPAAPEGPIALWVFYDERAAGSRPWPGR